MITVAIVGSRYWKKPEIVFNLCDRIISKGNKIATGCCVGVDEAALKWAVCNNKTSMMTCYCAFDKNCEGASPNLSAALEVMAFYESGGEVFWEIGGGLQHPLTTRLRNRTAALASANKDGAIVGFMDNPNSKGTHLAMRIAYENGLEVYAYPLFDKSLLKPIGFGFWGDSHIPGFQRFWKHPRLI
ncbi:MAG: hypothetical protein KAH77_01500 [Thiomargarita sp.]|nr:hypothetical protein [Thiomargarita sp.]